MQRVILGDNDIQALINGESVKVKMSDGTALFISQKSTKDIAAPLINYDKKIYSGGEIENIKRATRAMANAMRMGV